AAVGVVTVNDRRFLRHLIATVLAALFSSGAQSQAEDDASPFGQTRVWSIRLEIAPEEFDAMQPPPPGAPSAPAGTGGQRDADRNLFGTEFRWSRAEFSAEGETLKNVGVRYSGDMTYFVSAGGQKRPLKIAFDKFEKQRFQELSSVQ